MRYPIHYRRLRSIKDIEAEKRYLKRRLKRQEFVLTENWAEIKRPFRFTNMAVSLAGFLLPTKKARWIPLVLAGAQTAIAAAKRKKN